MAAALEKIVVPNMKERKFLKLGNYGVIVLGILLGYAVAWQRVVQ
jgi:hypothetical protein